MTLRNEPMFSQYAMDIVTSNKDYTSTAKYIQINPNNGNPIVSCYANTQQEICITFTMLRPVRWIKRKL